MTHHEPQPQVPDQLDTYFIGDRSLRSWHDYLTHEEGEMGMPTGHLSVPSSRYGTTTEECSWWAIAAEVARTQAIGEPDDPEASLDDLMTEVVNDLNDGEIATLVREHADAIPQAVLEHLDLEGPETEQWPELTYESPRDESLYLMSQEAWACESVSSDGPIGFTAWMSNGSSEIPEIVEVFRDEFADIGLDDHAKLIGNWLIMQSGAYVDVLSFSTEDDVHTAYDRVEALHNRMDGVVEEHSPTEPSEEA